RSGGHQSTEGDCHCEFFGIHCVSPEIKLIGACLADFFLCLTMGPSLISDPAHQSDGSITKT
ncbi:MAG: hypothetical protein ACI9ZF_003206, partial [Bradyrhizobium sp.]